MSEGFGSERFKVVPGSESAHCCFSFTVVDTEQPDGSTFKTICECFDEQDANNIAGAMNQRDTEGTL